MMPRRIRSFEPSAFEAANVPARPVATLLMEHGRDCMMELCSGGSSSLYSWRLLGLPPPQLNSSRPAARASRPSPHRPCYFRNSLPKMAQTRLLPRICIALGLPDVPTLLDHARREAEAGEIFWNSAWISWMTPERAPMPFAGFWNSFPSPSCWPPAGATRTTAGSTAASKSSLPCWTWRSRAGRTPSMWKSKPRRWRRNG